MTTFLATLDAPADFAAALADLMAEDDRFGADAAGAFDLGGGQWRLEAYFPGSPDPTSLAARSVAALELFGFDRTETAARLAGLRIRALGADDWTATGLADLPPIAAGVFRVFGEHNAPPAPDRRRHDLLIEASTAFGTGDHASTWLSLGNLDRILKRRRPRRVLDLGTGTGILGLAVARSVPAATVLASDIEPVAVHMAEQNRVGNGVSARFRTILADGLGDRRFRGAGPFDLVLANILPDPLTRLARPLVGLMAPGATLVIAGLRIGEEARLISAYGARGLVLSGRSHAKEWSSLVFTRPPARSGRRGRR